MRQIICLSVLWFLVAGCQSKSGDTVKSAPEAADTQAVPAALTLGDLIRLAANGESDAAVAGTDNVALQSAVRQFSPLLRGAGASQLWFQLHARTRFKEFASLHQEIAEQRPDETLMTLRSTLSPIRVGTIRAWDVNDVQDVLQDRVTGRVYLQRAHELSSLDLETNELTQVFDVAARYVGRVGDDELALRYDARRGHTLLRIADGSELLKLPASFPFRIAPFADGVVFSTRRDRLRFQSLVAGESPVQFSSGIDKPFVEAVFLQGIDGMTKLLMVTGFGDVLLFEHPLTPDQQPARFSLESSRASWAVLSPDESRLAVQTAMMAREPDSIQIWDIKRQMKLAVLEHPRLRTRTVGFLPDGGYLTSGSDGTLLVFDSSGELQREVFVGARSRSSRKMGSITYRPRYSREEYVLPEGSYHRFVILDQDRVLLVNHLGELSLVNPSLAQPPPSEPLKPKSLPTQRAHSSDGAWSGDFLSKQVAVFERKTGKTLKVLKAPQELTEQSGINLSVALQPNKKRVIAACENGAVIWNVDDGGHQFQEYQLTKPAGYEAKIDRTYAAAAQSGDRIAVWTIGRHHPTQHLLWIIDPETGEPERTLILPLWEMSRDYTVLSGDRLLLAYKSDSDQTGKKKPNLFLIDLTQDRGYDDLKQFRYSLGYAANDKMLVSCCTTGADPPYEMAVWDLASGELSHTFEQAEPGKIFGITADGRRFLSHTQNKLLIWDLPSGRVLQRYDLGDLTINGRSNILFDGRCVFFFWDMNKVRHQYQYIR